MTHGSLFTGIGAFDLAAEWLDWINAFHCEINPFCQQILKQHFPHAVSYSDIIQTDFTKWRGCIDVLSGGFPCQPVSNIGLQLGDADPRYLWPQYRRVYREIQPTWIVPENVYGLVTWDGGGLFETICKDLEADGYEVLPLIIPASSCGAGHQRKRVFPIAYSQRYRLERRQHSSTEGYRQTTHRPIPALVENRDWTAYAKSFIPGGAYGFPDRVDRTAALGNAVVPQVAYTIFKTIELYDLLY